MKKKKVKKKPKTKKVSKSKKKKKVTKKSFKPKTKKTKQDTPSLTKNKKRIFRVDFGRYGGEVTVGRVSPEFVKYFIDKDEGDLIEYLQNLEWNDPENPVDSYGGGVCCMGNAVKGGAFDQREIEKREDVLVYTSEPLKNGFEVTGFIESTIYISSDVKDTDITIKLI